MLYGLLFVVDVYDVGELIQDFVLCLVVGVNKGINDIFEVGLVCVEGYLQGVLRCCDMFGVYGVRFSKVYSSNFWLQG